MQEELAVPLRAGQPGVYDAGPPATPSPARRRRLRVSAPPHLTVTHDPSRCVASARLELRLDEHDVVEPARREVQRGRERLAARGRTRRQHHELRRERQRRRLAHVRALQHCHERRDPRAGARGRPETGGSSCCCPTRKRPSTATARAPTTRRPTSRSCSAATARCSARCDASSAPACPVLGVNLGRVGFLTSIMADALEDGLRRAFAGELELVELPALEASAGGERWLAVNDVVVAQLDDRPDDRAWLGDRRRGSRPAALRRPDLLDARRGRRPTTSRTAARCSSGGWTRWRSPSSRRIRCMRGRWWCRAAASLAVTNGTPRRERDRARRRPAGARARARRPGRSAARGTTQPARDPSGEHLLQPLPPHIRLRVESGTQTARSRHTCVRVGPLPSPNPPPTQGRAREQEPAAQSGFRGSPPAAGGRSIQACFAGSYRESRPDPRGGARARAGLNAITGETGAGKTILAQAIGLLLGAKGDAGLVGPAREAYVEAELDRRGAS